MSTELTLYVVELRHALRQERTIIGLVHVGRPPAGQLFDLCWKGRPSARRIKLWPEPIFTVQREAALDVVELDNDNVIKLSPRLRARLENEAVTDDSAGPLRELTYQSVQFAAGSDWNGGKWEDETAHRVISVLNLYQSFWPKAKIIPYWS